MSSNEFIFWDEMWNESNPEDNFKKDKNETEEDFTDDFLENEKDDPQGAII